MMEPTEQEYIDSLKAKKISLKNIPARKRTKEICLTAVKMNCFELEFVKKQTEEICFAAVKQNGCALSYVKNQTDEICLAAVRSNGIALGDVICQTEEVCLAAVKSYGPALEWVKEQTEDICLAAVRQNGSFLRLVKNPTYKIIKEAIKNNKKSINFIYGNSFISPLKPTRAAKSLDKLAEIMMLLDENDLITDVNNDLKEIFTEENLKLSEKLFNIKSKADMIVEAGNSKRINIIDKKPKII